MKKVLHISTECYPAAKSGGLGDVVGALPIYQSKTGYQGSVIIPKYDLPWFNKQKFRSKHQGELNLGDRIYNFEVLKLKNDALPYTFYCIDLPELFDRTSIYLNNEGQGFADEPERNIGFQRAVLQWLCVKKHKFDLLHCHDHQTGLIPFMLKCSEEFDLISDTPTIFTIHNAQYKGLFQWTDQHLLPSYDVKNNGWLDWDNCIHSLASAVKLADKVTTVSPSYMVEITNHSGSLEYLFKDQHDKCSGIINGIDNNAWDPKTDTFLKHKRTHRWIILGSGDKSMEQEIVNLEAANPDQVKALIMYNEGVAHEIYAGCDFLMMPSRFEPCGLNQMYAMRYGTIPVVRSTGGLKDTVPDYKDSGNGIAYAESSVSGLSNALTRAIALSQKEEFKKLRKKIVSLDFSWQQSIKLYADLYNEVLA